MKRFFQTVKRFWKSFLSIVFVENEPFYTKDPIDEKKAEEKWNREN